MATHKIRLRLPSGAELEAEGDSEFVRAEREGFLQRLGPPPAPPERPGTGKEQASGGAEPRVDWAAVAEARRGGLHLRAKLPGGDKAGKDAALLLLLASERLLGSPKPTATALARWLRASGYPVGRMDRILQDALGRGELLASGSRRARRYELTPPGKIQALLLAEALTAAVNGPG